MKETKTAEEAVKIFIKHDPLETIKASADQWVMIINAMQEYAEQARREERDKYEELVIVTRDILDRTLSYGEIDENLEYGLKAAGYGKEEQNND